RDHWETCLDRARAIGLNISVLRNPRRTTSAAVNLACRATTAPKVLWISGHCRLSPEYVENAVDAHRSWGAIAAGGRVIVRGRGLVGRLNALLLRSRFGTGMAVWRYARTPGWVEIVNYALFDREQLMRVGGIDERLGRNQDNDLFERLREAGIRCRLIDAEAEYLAPATLGGLLRRGWGNGAWTVWSRRLGRHTARWYHWAPFAAVVTGLALLGAGLLWKPALTIAAGLAAVYAALALIASIARATADHELWAVLILPLWFVLFHAAYGFGTLAALFRPVPRLGEQGT
ncbi:MAG: glycosyltransferase, partial [Candidatus Zixiibacteriota bacterium]